MALITLNRQGNTINVNEAQLTTLSEFIEADGSKGYACVLADGQTIILSAEEYQMFGGTPSNNGGE